MKKPHAELNSGEIYLDENMEKILEVPASKEFLHKNGGFKEDDVSFVLNNAYNEDKTSELNKKLLLTPEDLEEITGVKAKKGDKKMTHSKAFKKLSEHYQKNVESLEKSIEKSYEDAKSTNSPYAKNSLELNLKHLNDTPTDIETFKKLYSHQEKVKDQHEEDEFFMNDIPDEELDSFLSMVKGGRKRKYKYQEGGNHLSRIEDWVKTLAKKPEWKGTNDASYREGLIKWYEDIINNPYVKEDKEQLKDLLEEVKNADPPKFGAKAGVLQRAVKKALPESSLAYARSFPLTRTALKNLYEANPQAYRQAAGKDWSPMDNSATLDEPTMSALKNAFLQEDGLGAEGLIDANFVDDEWYYRRPYFRDEDFGSDVEGYQQFIKKYQDKGITDADYEKGVGFLQVAPNAFVNPKVTRIVETNDAQEYKQLLEDVKGRDSFQRDGLIYHLENKDNNIGEYVAYTLNIPDEHEHVVDEEEKKATTTLPLPEGRNNYDQPYTFLDAAGNIASFLAGAEKKDVIYDPLEVRAPDVYLQDPRPALENATQTYNAILDTLPQTGVGFANAANLFRSKLQQDNQVLGQYEAANKQLLTQRDQIAANVFNLQEQYNNQAREIFERKTLTRDAIFDLQLVKNIDDISQEIALNKKHNREGDLIMAMVDYYTQTGDYNGLQYMFNQVQNPIPSNIPEPKKRK